MKFFLPINLADSLESDDVLASWIASSYSDLHSGGKRESIFSDLLGFINSHAASNDIKWYAHKDNRRANEQYERVARQYGCQPRQVPEDPTFILYFIPMGSKKSGVSGGESSILFSSTSFTEGVFSHREGVSLGEKAFLRSGVQLRGNIQTPVRTRMEEEAVLSSPKRKRRSRYNGSLVNNTFAEAEYD